MISREIGLTFPPDLDGTPREFADRRRVYLSILPAGRGQRRFAAAVLVVSAVLFLAAAPFATLPLGQLEAFMPGHQSALVINDLITAVLLLGQYGILRSRALLVLASAYLFSALMAVSHALSFPGLFLPAGLPGAGPQTTAWLYFFWHGGFPLMVIAYALLKDERHEADRLRASPRTAILTSVGAVIVVACVSTFLATAGHDALPQIMQGNGDVSATSFAAAGTWLLSLAALPILFGRRPHSLLDLWLMVTMCVWIFEITLASVLSAGRYDLGWYAGRIYALLAASFVLVVLLMENSVLYAKVVKAGENERRRAQDELARRDERLRILHEIDRAIIAKEPPEAMAGAVIRPLRELLAVPRVIVNIFDLEAGEAEWLAAAGRHRIHLGPGVRYSLRLMGDLAALKRGEPQIIDTHALPPGPEVDALLASGVHAYLVVPMIAGHELIGALSFGGEQASFPPQQVSIAREVAAQLAIAIMQARLLERVKHEAEDLELKVRERTVELQTTNRELEAFSYSVSHDLRSPLRAVIGYASMLEEDYGDRLDDEGRRLLATVSESAGKMGQLIDDLLAFSRLGHQPVIGAPVNMGMLVRQVIDAQLPAPPGARLVIGELPDAHGDRALLRQVWANLIANARKYSGKKAQPVIEIGGRVEDRETAYWVRDNGAGFDMRYYDKLFGVFQRLHAEDEFAGSGVGLAIVDRVVTRHGGRVWAEGKTDVGATFHFALPTHGLKNG